MKTLRLYVIAIAALALAGCAAVESVMDTARRVTSVVTSPVTMYTVKSTYDLAGTGAARWRATCWSKTYAEIMRSPVYRPICQNRRARLRAIDAASDRAGAAIETAERLAASGGDVGGALSIAWNAVQAFKGLVPATP